MATIDIPKTEFTVREVADLFGKDASHIRRLCLLYDLGTIHFGQIRLLKQRDIRKLEVHFAKKGRNRQKNSDA